MYNTLIISLSFTKLSSAALETLSNIKTNFAVPDNVIYNGVLRGDLLTKGAPKMRSAQRMSGYGV